MSEFVPEGWSEARLADITQVITKGTTPKKYSTKGINFVKVESVSGSATLLPSKFAYIDNFVHESFKRSQLSEGDILFSIAGSLGRLALVENQHLPANTNQALAIIRLKKGVINTNFCIQQLKGEQVQSELVKLQTVGAQPNLSLQQISDICLKVPPLPEQQKMAAILTSVDEVIEKTQAQINKLKDLKTGMMQELLTRGVGVDGKPHTEFKDSPVGRIPKGWDVVKLSEIIGSMDGGVSVNGENRLKTHKEIGVLKVSSVFKGAFIPHEHKVVIEEDLNRVKINPLKDRILFSRANTPSLVGESGYVERNYDDLYLPDKIWMIDVKDRLKVNVRWLSYILSSGKVRKLICDAATGTSSSMKNISKPNLLSIQVGMPMLEEQKAIADILNLISNKLTLSLTKLDHVKQLKKALMQDLLTGKVRVKVDTE